MIILTFGCTFATLKAEEQLTKAKTTSNILELYIWKKEIFSLRIGKLYIWKKKYLVWELSVMNILNSLWSGLAMVFIEAKFLYKVWKEILNNFPISKILNLITDVNFQADDIFQKFPASRRSVDGWNFAAEIQSREIDQKSPVSGNWSKVWFHV